MAGRVAFLAPSHDPASAEKGGVAPGMVADVAVLSQDVTRVPAAALPAAKSLLSIVGGRAYAAPQFIDAAKHGAA